MLRDEKFAQTPENEASKNEASDSQTWNSEFALPPDLSGVRRFSFGFWRNGFGTATAEGRVSATKSGDTWTLAHTVTNMSMDGFGDMAMNVDFSMTATEGEVASEAGYHFSGTSMTVEIQATKQFGVWPAKLTRNIDMVLNISSRPFSMRKSRMRRRGEGRVYLSIDSLRVTDGGGGRAEGDWGEQGVRDLLLDKKSAEELKADPTNELKGYGTYMFHEYTLS